MVKAKTIVSGPCKVCLQSDYYEATRKCVTCSKHNVAKWRQENRDRYLSGAKKYRTENPEAVNSAQKYCRELRGKVYQASARAKYANDPTLWLTHSRTRKIRKRTAQPAWINAKNLVAIYRQCRKVSQETGILHHVDHVIPLKHNLVCGLHVPWNLQIITAKENRKKWNNFEMEIKDMSVLNAP